LLPYANLDQDLIRKIQDGFLDPKSTNVSIRHGLADAVREYYSKIMRGRFGIDDGDYPPTPAGSETEFDSAALKILKQVAMDMTKPITVTADPITAAPSSINGRYADVSEVYNAWLVAYRAYLASVPSDNDRKVADLANDEVKAYKDGTDARQDKRSKDLSGIAQHLANAQVTFATGIDLDSQTPASVDKAVDKPTGDQLKIDISTDTVSLISAKTQGLDDKRASVAVASTPVTSVKSVTLEVYGRPVYDFSAGLTVSSLLNSHYYVKKQPAGSTPATIVARGVSDVADISAGVLGQYYRTRPGDFTYGPALGVTQGDSTRFLAGLSLIIGHKTRFSITGGLAVGKVNRLSGDVLGSAPNGDKVNTESVLRAGGFLSATFNLSF
jgi:hypothetical protein